MSAILRFYRDGGADDRGRTFAEILCWPDWRLEETHDYIQWLFPLREPSGANPAAPVLSAADIALMRNDASIRGRLRAAFQRMLAFYGLIERGGEVEMSSEFAERSRTWLHAGNHNHLRITRILRCLRLLGLEAEAQAFWRLLKQLYEKERGASGNISPRTFEFWRKAAEQV